MARVAPKPKPDPTPKSEIEKAVREQLEIRKWRAVNYLSHFAFYIVVYTAAILTDYYLFWLIGTLLALDSALAAAYPWLLLAVDFVKVSTALCGVATGLVHLGYATWGQIQLERDLDRLLEMKQARVLPAPTDKGEDNA